MSKIEDGKAEIQVSEGDDPERTFPAKFVEEDKYELLPQTV
jgi:hypothetical protein